MKLSPDPVDWPLAKSHLKQGSCCSGRCQFANVTCFRRKQEKDVVAAFKNLMKFRFKCLMGKEKYLLFLQL